MPEIYKTNEKARIVLVGMKVEKRGDDGLDDKGIKCVSKSKGQRMKIQLNAMSFVECSVINKMHMTKVLTKAVRCALRPKRAKWHYQNCKVL